MSEENDDSNDETQCVCSAIFFVIILLVLFVLLIAVWFGYYQSYNKSVKTTVTVQAEILDEDEPSSNNITQNAKSPAASAPVADFDDLMDGDDKPNPGK